jgi:NitT/TauT family transport system substrate-binding protein
MHYILPLSARRSVLAIIWLTVLALGLASCGVGSPAANTPATKLKVQLSWVHEYSSAPFYAAEKKGHFAEQNLEVHLEASSFGDKGFTDPIGEVLSGAADFGVVNAATIILARAEGKPVVAIASVLQRSPQAVISLDTSNIRRPQDMVGQQVAVAEGGAIRTYHTLLASQGIDRSKIQIIPRKSYGVDPLLKNEVDAIVGWVINEGVQLREAGQTPNYILMSDYGVDTYETLIFTTEKMIAERADLVERFMRAVMQGTQDVVDAPEQAADFVLAYDSKLDREGQLRRLQAMLPLIKPAGARPGMMQADVWQSTYDILRDQDVLHTSVDVNAAYTLAFLEKIYGK